MASPLTLEILALQKARHVAFLHARLVSAEAAAEWVAAAPAIHDALLSARVGDVIDAPALAAAVDASLGGEAVERAARPLAQRLLPVILAELRAEPGKVNGRVPAASHRHIDALVAHPGLLPERLLREIVEQDAIDEIMRDVLYDGFKEFSEKVNPFTAEWGIPSLLKRMTLLGGAMTKGVDTVKAELDRRMEPEIRRFLAGFSRRGLRRMVDVTIARGDQPTSIAVRKHMVAWLLDQEIAALAREADPVALAIAAELGLDIAAAELSRPEGRARRRALLEAAIADARDKTVREALAELGVTLQVDDRALAAAAWPAVRTALGSPAVKAWLEKVVGEFYEGRGGGGRAVARGGSAPLQVRSMALPQCLRGARGVDRLVEPALEVGEVHGGVDARLVLGREDELAPGEHAAERGAGPFAVPLCLHGFQALVALPLQQVPERLAVGGSPVVERLEGDGVLQDPGRRERASREDRADRLAGRVHLHAPGAGEAHDPDKERTGREQIDDLLLELGLVLPLGRRTPRRAAARRCGPAGLSFSSPPTDTSGARSMVGTGETPASTPAGRRVGVAVEHHEAGPVGPGAALARAHALDLVAVGELVGLAGPDVLRPVGSDRDVVLVGTHGDRMRQRSAYAARGRSEGRHPAEHGEPERVHPLGKRAGPSRVC